MNSHPAPIHHKISPLGLVPLLLLILACSCNLSGMATPNPYPAATPCETMGLGGGGGLPTACQSSIIAPTDVNVRSGPSRSSALPGGSP
jgi:hypothetical protein